MNEDENYRSRVSILATLGGELSRLGLGYQDRDALRAVLASSLADFAGSLGNGGERSKISLGEAIAAAIDSQHGPMSIAGVAILHDRRASAYHEDYARWADQPEIVKNGRWRDLPPTRGQRMLMIRMAEELRVELPGEVTRGGAQAWISDHGGNPRYSADKKR